MATKQNVDALLRKNLGKEVAGEVIRKINKMVKSGTTPAKIEKAITADLVTHIQKQVALAVISRSGPLVPIKVTPIKTSIVKSTPIAIGPIQVKVPSVKIGPGPIVRGAKK